MPEYNSYHWARLGLALDGAQGQKTDKFRKAKPKLKPMQMGWNLGPGPSLTSLVLFCLINCC
jgi:hypothetical protein